MIYLFLISFPASSQSDTIYLSIPDAEELFLKTNLRLLSERFNIEKAEAALIQARLWTNPTFTLDPVNLWATPSQKDGRDEVAPALFGDFGRNMSLAVGIEQKISLSGKRRKLIAAERVSPDISRQYFEELLRNLKIELRRTCAELIYLQEYQKLIERQSSFIDRLIVNQRKQQDLGNISSSKLLRMEASALEIHSEYIAIQRDLNQMQRDIKILLNISSQKHVYITDHALLSKSPDSLSYNALIDIALDSRPDLKAAIYQSDYYVKLLRYEKAQRLPDLSLRAQYDRSGNIIKNFVGFGFGIDLPIFHRNQGKIKEAQAHIHQNKIDEKHLMLVAMNEVDEALKNYSAAYSLMQKISEDSISAADEMLGNYTKNFIDKNIGIVEFLDFFEAYRASKKILLETKRNLYTSYEELKFALGTELF